MDPPQKRESTSSNKNRSKSLDPVSRNSKCYLGIPHTFEDEDLEFMNYCVEEGIDGARDTKVTCDPGIVDAYSRVLSTYLHTFCIRRSNNNVRI